MRVLALMFSVIISVNGLSQNVEEQSKVLQEQGRSLIEVGKYDEAIIVLNKVLEIDPLLYNIYNELGVAYSKKREYEKAIECFKKSADMVGYLDPGPISNLAYLYAYLKDYDNAIIYFKMALKASYISLEYIDQIARMYANKRDYHNAILWWNEFLKIKEHPVICINIANTYKQLDDRENEIIYLKKASELGSEAAIKRLEEYTNK